MNNINEYICINLCELKRTNPEFYDQAYNILTFIYKDIDKEFLSQEREKLFMESWVPRIDSYSSYNYEVEDFKKERKDIFITFVNGKMGIIETLFDMCKCNDRRFANKFFESVDMPIKMFRDGISYDTSPIAYIFNLYTMLTAYRMYKGDYASFVAVIEDSKYSFSEEKNDNNKENYYGDKKRMIDSILENNDYHNLTGLRMLLRNLLFSFKKRWGDKEKDRYNEALRYHSKLNSAIIQAKKEGKNFSEETVAKIISDIALFCDNKRINQSNPEMYFERVLLFNNRYQFINERLPKLDNSISFKKQVAGYIANMDIEFFEYVNGLNIYYDDSFVEMMKIVFDSDSFKSVFSRLSAITRASQCYIDGNREEMLQILKELPSSKHSSYDDGIEVKLKQENNNNTKPESISERMILFYQLNFGLGPKPDCLRKYKNNYYQDISEFISDLEQEVKRVNQVETTSIELDNKSKKNLLSIFK